MKHTLRGRFERPSTVLILALVAIATGCASSVGADAGPDVTAARDVPTATSDVPTAADGGPDVLVDDSDAGPGGPACPATVSGMACAAGARCHAPDDCAPTGSGAFYVCWEPLCHCDATGRWSCNFEHSPCTGPYTGQPIYTDGTCETVAGEWAGGDGG